MRVASSERVEAAIDFVGYNFYEFEVGVEGGFDVYVAGFAFSFAQVEQRVKGGGVRAGEGGYGGDGFAFGRGHGLA
jgi:hypothetical protein